MGNGENTAACDQETRTWFAPAERSSEEEIVSQVRVIANNGLVSGLLTTVQGLLAVLNENRQILAVNETLLKNLNITDAHTIFGLRPGEAVGCVHATDNVGGCGTGKFCATCGAAIAMVTTLASDEPQERKCILQLKNDGIQTDICFSVRAVTTSIEDQRFILLLLQDLTEEERRAAMERVFFHDLNNIVMALAGLAQVASIGASPATEAVTKRMTALCRRLVREVQMQKALVQGEGYQLQQEVASIADVMREMKAIVADLPQAQGKTVVFAEESAPAFFVTDLPLLERVLTNMTINALEASPEGGEVVVSVTRDNDDIIRFKVWNEGYIPEKIALRIFQRYFTTKEGRGRGFGTYSIKFFGENYLGGNVGFSTSPASGTTFTLSLPQLCRNS